jgi:hypothetical protein
MGQRVFVIGILYFLPSGMAADPLPTGPYPQQAKPARVQPAIKKGSLLGTIADALGGDDRNDNQRRVQAVADRNIRNREAALRPQFQQLLYGELAFLRRACTPDVKPFAEIARAAKADLDLPLREYATWYVTRRRDREGSNPPDPRSEMQKLLAPLVEAKLGPEKARLYRQECDKRAEARKHAVVVNVVAVLDERLVLTAQQRAKLVQSFSANYENGWDQYVEMYGMNGQVVPSIRDESIVPLLDEQQKGVWEQTTKLGRQVVSSRIVRNLLGVQAPEIQEIARIAEEVQDGR